MATRIGWVGEPSWQRTLKKGEIGHGRIPIANAASDGTYIDTYYTMQDMGNYQCYWTISSNSQLTMWGDEYPVSVTIGDYDGTWSDDWHTNDPVLLSNGQGASFGYEYTLFPDFKGSGWSGTATIPVDVGANFAGCPLSLSIKSTVELYGHFKVTVSTNYKSYTVTYSTNGNGTITGGAASLSRGQTTDFTVKANTGYKIKSVTQNSTCTLQELSKTDTEIKYRLTMTTPGANVAISATFEKQTYSITPNASISGAGTVKVSGTGQMGNVITVTQTTSDTKYYHFDGWSIKSGNSSITPSDANANTTTFTMPASNVVVTALYTQHAVTWQDAEIKASQDSIDVTISYKGIATDNFTQWDSSHVLKYYLYRDGTSIQEIATSTKEWQSVVIQVDSEDEGKDIRFSVVAKDEATGVAAGGATVSLNVADIYRLVGLCIEGNRWIECIPHWWIGNEWVEVEPYYYDGNDGWQLCALN